ncbi:carboxypeptidase-like regulatory domain-containing protein [Candidatus Bathyarchaeota archaeon]|nr:carboxypeptidase-like regulatory domain-containing protein [Candidatus Bathyarchaeota archaeon]
MERRFLPAVVLVLTVYLAVCLPTFAVAYTTPPGYSGKPIKYGGWLVGQVLMEISHIVQKIPWATITVTNADGTFTKTATTNGYGYYRVYLPPGEYKVTVSYARYSQTYDVTIRVDQEYRFLNVYLERPDMPEFQDRLAHK